MGKLVVIDAFVHIFQYSQEILSLLVKQRAVSKLNESCVLVNKCLSFTISIAPAFFPLHSQPFSTAGGT